MTQVARIKGVPHFLKTRITDILTDINRILEYPIGYLDLNKFIIKMACLLIYF